MQDERNMPQEDDAEEVEGHLRRRADEPVSDQDDADDEVEAHQRKWGPAETRAHNPSE